MKLQELITKLRKLRVKLWAEGSKLHYSAPPEVMTDAILAEITENKGELLSWIGQTQPGDFVEAPPIEATPRGGLLPLSFAQQRLWFIEQITQDNAAYNMLLVIRLDGTLDRAALEASLNEIVARHETLRTSFPVDNGEPYQCIAPHLELQVPLVELGDIEPDRQEEAIAQRIREGGRRAFDLSKGPLVRATLFRLDDATHVLSIAMHHIISDGWSIEVLYRELAALYEAKAHGQQASLPELQIQYADFAVWQREWMRAQTLEKQLGYWKERLADLPELGLPTDHARPVVQGHSGDELQLVLPERLCDRLDALCRREQVTLFMTLLAAFTVMLQRHGAGDDIVVGSPVANRNRLETEGIFGFFVNSLVMRSDLSGNPTVRELLNRVKASATGAYDHQDVPFEALVKELAPKRDLSRHPLFQVMLAVQQFSTAPQELEDLTLSVVRSPINTTRFDLEVHVRPTSSEIVVAFVYDTDLFDRETVERYLSHYEHLLETFVEEPGLRISELPMLGDDERRRLLVEWNDTQRDYPRESCIQELFEEQVERSPDAVALDYEGERLTYAELNRRANRLAHRLLAMDVGPEVMVGLCIERSIEMVVSLLGVLKAGGAYVPLDPSYPPSRLQFMLEDTAAPVLLTLRSLRDRLPEYSGQVLCVDELESSEVSHAETNPPVTVGANNLAYVIYTSGSTGTPKGTCIEHRGVVRLVKSADYVEIAPSDVFLQFVPISFDVSTFELWAPLLNGAKLVVHPPGVPSLQGLGEAIRKNEVSVLWLTAPLFHQMVDAQRESLRGVRQLLAGGEALSVPHVRRMIEVLKDGHRLINGYGPTENTTFTACHVMTRSSRVEATVPIGRPISNTRTHVLDLAMNPVPIGVVGELYTGGDGLAREYLHRPELTDEKFVKNPFGEGRLYRTGDLARYRSDGTLEFLGRADHQVKVRGFRVELGEIETALLRLPDVHNAVVLCREDSPGDKRLAAYVVGAEPKHPPSVKDLRCFLQDELPAYMVPSAFVLLESLPLTPVGKVDRKSLPAPEWDRAGVDTSYVAPRSGLEEQVAQLWRDLLGTTEVGVRDNFFDLGGHSLLVTQIKWKLETELGRDVPMVALFQYPTIESLARYLEGGSRDSEFAHAARSRMSRRGEAHSANDAIAIVGMAVRFPDADDVDAFWKNIANGVESVRVFTEAQLKEAGVDPATLSDPSYVPAGAMLEGAELFDASLFGYSARDAELIDPQQRLFLECSWEALERAAYDPRRYDGLIGVYAGASASAYVDNLRSHPELVALTGALQLTIGSRADFLPTRVSYKLDLRGPAVAVQTACSTSLVAVHEACRSLVDYQCDIALAGGAKVNVPRALGYTYVEGGILSPDGHCRSFDAEAKGTVGGEGVGVVVLKRLAEAVEDGDVIHAVIRATASNNDGSQKVAYTAPSTQAQAEVIALAQAAAGVQPESIGYIEAHGTATNLGDPIEVAALNMVFGDGSSAKRQCALGTVKTNIGHLDTAAGVAGLVKTVQALKHRQLPPSLHFNEPNPEIDFDAGPLYVNTVLQEWPASDGLPRRAGVSSFGMGGTNAHAVVEEAPAMAASDTASRPEQLLVVSAKTPAALERASENLSKHLQQRPEESLSDVAFTLQVGRSELEHRRAVMASSAAEAIAALEGERPKARWTGRATSGEHEVAFLFPGQGAQYVNMGVELYRRERVYRETVDRCCELLLEDELGADLRETLYPAAGVSEAASARLKRTSWAQPALFVVEYALTAQWRSWGIEPSVCVGHSVGELVAACVSGVLGLEDALRLVALRGRLMEAMPEGVMTSVPLAADEVETRLEGEPHLWLSVVNGPSLCVVSGAADRVAEWEVRLAAEGIECRRLHTSHAFHSGLMDDAVAPFAAAVQDVNIGEPQIPYLSNLTGKWITAEDVRDPSYWGRHIREAVQFDACLAEVLSVGRRALLEVGPGRVLGTLARQQSLWGPERVAASSLPDAGKRTSDSSFLFGGLAHLWTAGVSVDWNRVHGGERRRRVELPTYPFERERYWIDRAPETSRAPQRRGDLAEWFYIPSWQHSMLPALRRDDGTSSDEWLVFADASDFVRNVVASLNQAGRRLCVVEAGEGFARSAEGYVINPRSREDYTRLLSELTGSGRVGSRIVHLWGATVEHDRSDATAERCAALGFFSLLYLAQALDDAMVTSPVRLDVGTVGVHGLREGEELHPEKATMVGPCRTIGREFPNVSCRHIDLAVHEVTGNASGSVELLLRELSHETDETMVAFRRGSRLVESFAPTRMDELESEHPRRLRRNGTYWVTGGLGGIGLELAKYLARSMEANLVLTTRTGLPDRMDWPDYVSEHGSDDSMSRRIRGVQTLEASGAEVLVAEADAADLEAMRSVVSEAIRRFGRIDGVIHAAGIAGEGVMVLKDREQAASVLAPKVTGARVLERLFGDADLDWLVLCSSLSAVIEQGGQVDYCAANAYLDAFARDFGTRTGIFAVSINWNGWRESGMAVDYARRQGRAGQLEGSSNDEGVELFRRVVDRATEPQVLISERDLSAVLRAPGASSHRGEQSALSESEQVSMIGGGHARPSLSTEFVAASSETELALVVIWQGLLGLEQVGIHDNFMDLGGHSLLATQLTARMRAELSTELSLKDVFAGPTVAELASRIDQQKADESEQRIAELTDRIQKMSPAERRDLLEEARRAGELGE